jgi:hypothetical protein
LQVDAAHFAIGAVQFPALAGFVLADAQGDVLGEFSGVHRTAGAVQVLRAGDQQLLDLAEAAHHQAAVVIEFRAHAQGDIDSLR